MAFATERHISTNVTRHNNDVYTLYIKMFCLKLKLLLKITLVVIKDNTDNGPTFSVDVLIKYSCRKTLSLICRFFVRIMRDFISCIEKFRWEFILL